VSRNSCTSKQASVRHVLKDIVSALHQTSAESIGIQGISPAANDHAGLILGYRLRGSMSPSPFVSTGNSFRRMHYLPAVQWAEHLLLPPSEYGLH
jgi:hypothetical protein